MTLPEDVRERALLQGVMARYRCNEEQAARFIAASLPAALAGMVAAAEVAYAAGRADERGAVTDALEKPGVRTALYATFSDDLRERVSRSTLYAVLGALAEFVERGEYLGD